MILEILLLTVLVAALKVGITNEVRNRRNRKYRRDAIVFYDRQNTR